MEPIRLVQEPDNSFDQRRWIGGLGHDGAAPPRVGTVRVTAVQDEGDGTLLESTAYRVRVPIPEPEINYRSRQPVLLDAVDRIGNSPRRQCDGTDLLEGIDNAERNKRLILDDEDRATSQAGALHDTSPARLSANA